MRERGIRSLRLMQPGLSKNVQHNTVNYICQCMQHLLFTTGSVSLKQQVVEGGANKAFEASWMSYRSNEVSGYI